MTAMRARQQPNFVNVEDVLPFTVKVSQSIMVDQLSPVYQEQDHWVAFSVQSGVLHAFLRHSSWGHAVPYACLSGHVLVVHPTISYRFLPSDDCRVVMMEG